MGDSVAGLKQNNMITNIPYGVKEGTELSKFGLKESDKNKARLD